MFIINGMIVMIKKEKIIDNLNLEIGQGTITCIVAPNGTGKTTLFKAISNKIKKKGTVKINGDNSSNRIFYNKQLVFLEESENLIANFTAIENLELIKILWNSDVDINEVITLLEMEGFKNKKVGKMSLGMKQKVLIASMMVSDASLLIFDEPLNGLDIKNIELITRIFLELKNKGKSIILSSHNVHDISAICDDIYFLKQGKLIAIQNNFDLIKRKYFEMFS